MMTTISIKGLDKAKVLIALHKHAKPAGLGRFHPLRGCLTLEEAQELVEQSKNFDYLRGCPIKTDLSGDTIDGWLYDHDHGPGAAQAAIAEVRSQRWEWLKNLGYWLLWLLLLLVPVLGTMLMMQLVK